MSDSEDFDAQDFDYQLIKQEEQVLSIKKYLPEANQLMEQILFCSYTPKPLFPQPFTSIPPCMKADTAKVDNNNMNLIEESEFRHEKLKKDVLGFLMNKGGIHKTVNRKSLPTLGDYYQTKSPCYEKYPASDKSKCLATYILDYKAILKHDLKKKASHSQNKSRSQSVQTTHRNRNKIQFDSNFQCGNLFRVYQNSHNQFDLILQNDVNTKGNNQWFFFKIRNAPKGMNIKINIVNFSKKNSLFDSGMKPYVFSVARFDKRKVGWVREGMKVNYEENQRIRRQTSQKPYYCLSFEYKFAFEGDIVYFSHSIPYGVTQLSNFIREQIKEEKKNNKLIKFKNLGRTVGNQEVDIISITDQEARQKKKVVWVIGRQHSGEVTSSFMMEGIIRTLLNRSSQSRILLKKYIFKLLPMLNVDGVVHGNSRADLSGADPNRKWAHPHKIRNPIVWELKKAIQKDKGNIEMFLDLHSHSKKLGTFFYGNTLRDSKVSTRKFPIMVCQNDPRFDYLACRFSPCNNQSARHVLFESLQIPMVYTVESSFYGYLKNGLDIVQYLPKDYQEMGDSLIQTFFELQNRKDNWSQSLSLVDMQRIKVEEQLEAERGKEEELDRSVCSDSDPSDDEFDDSELKKLLPAVYESKKTKKVGDMPKKKKKKVEKIEKQKEDIPPKPKKSQKNSHYRIYFSGRHSCLQKRARKQKPEGVQMEVQVSIPESKALKKSGNNPNPFEKRNSLYVCGQKFDDELTVLGTNVGVQAEISKILGWGRNTQDRGDSLPSRKSFKLTSRNSSILQVKQNNFLNRADCHTMPTINFMQLRR